MTVGALTACPAGADDSVIAAAQGQALAVVTQPRSWACRGRRGRGAPPEPDPEAWLPAVLPVARKARTGSRRTSPRQAFHAAFYGK